jgi:hypothetical protein
MSRTPLVLALLLFGAGPLPAQRPGTAAPPRIIEAARRTGPIDVDGKLDEPAWATAPVSDRFVQSYPKPNAPATDPTEVRVLYDDDALYVGVRMFDAHPDSIVGRLTRRDPTSVYSDYVYVIVDSYHDRRTAFAFGVNPLGVQRDLLLYNDNSQDQNWDAVWESAARVDSAGWSAEFRIPFSQLRFAVAAADTERVWGFEVFRDVARRNERDSWAPWDPALTAVVSRFGDLDCLVGVRARVHAEVVPYASSKLTRAPAQPGDPFHRATSAQPSVGADFKLSLPKGLTVTGAVNPDFGQVEVDPAVVNLSAYETFFPEKRPFFVEGSGIFQFGQTRTYNNYQFQQYFYSRRVGRPPTRTLAAPYVDAPEATRIDGAVKLTGRAGAWTVGALDALTPRETARFRASTDGETQHAPVEPLANYFVGRLKRDFRHGQTVIGAMLTAAHRALADTAFTPLLHDRAAFGGVDFEHGWDHASWYLSGYAAASQVTGAAGANGSIAATERSSTHYFQRPDASYLHVDTTRSSLAGGTAELALQHTGNVALSVDLKTVSPGFEINDLGFLNRADYHALSWLAGYQSFKAGRTFRTHSYGLYGNDAWNYGGTAIQNTLSAFASGTLRNFWFLDVNLTRGGAVESDQLTRGGPLARVPGTLTGNLTVGSDSRRAVSVQSTISIERDRFGGGHSAVGAAAVTVRPASNVSLTIGPTLTRLASSDQYIQTVADSTATATYAHRYVFARLHQNTLSADTRLDWTFAPMLSLQLYAQPFVSAGRFTEFKELRRGATAAYGVYGADQGSIAPTATGYVVDPDGLGPAPSFQISNPDFNVRSLRGDAVLRWQYRPGSALFVVWQQQRSGAGLPGEFDVGRDVGAIFREPATNVLLVKVTYWMSG